jgi:hypothetical protein
MVERHPEWFDQPRIDIEDGHEGWGQLIDNAFRSAEQILSDYRDAPFRIVQVKEKLGALTIYFHAEGLPTEVSDRLSETMQAARKQSLYVCEICGASACLGNTPGCISVRCPSCAVKGADFAGHRGGAKPGQLGVIADMQRGPIGPLCMSAAEIFPAMSG